MATNSPDENVKSVFSVPEHARQQPKLAQAIHAMLFPDWDLGWKWRALPGVLAAKHMGHPDLKRRVFWLSDPGSESEADWVDLFAHAEGFTLYHGDAWRTSALGAVEHARSRLPRLAEPLLKWVAGTYKSPGFTDAEVLRFDPDEALARVDDSPHRRRPG